MDSRFPGLLSNEYVGFVCTVDSRTRRVFEFYVLLSWAIASCTQCVAGVLLLLYRPDCSAPTNFWLVLDGVLVVLLVLVFRFVQYQSLRTRVNWKNARHDSEVPRCFTRKEWESLRNVQREVAGNRDIVIGAVKMLCGVPLVGANLAVKVTGNAWFWFEFFPKDCDNVAYLTTLLFACVQIGLVAATSCWWFGFKEPEQVLDKVQLNCNP
eukprot:5246072-Pyramimonas_sp.AAC.1